MNLSQLINEVNKDIDDALSSSDVIGWLNRALDDLTPLAKKEARAYSEVSVTDAALNSYTLPSDLHQMVFVRVNGEEYKPMSLNDATSIGYKTWGNSLFLQPPIESGEIELFYYKQLAHLENDVDIPEIEPAFHDLLVLYAIAHSQFMDEEPERQQDAAFRYRQRKDEYEAYKMRNDHTLYQVIDVGGF